jgi:hypothetical protein
MKAFLALPNSLTLSALLLTAHAQTPATGHDNPTPAKPTSTTKVVKVKEAKGTNDKSLGQKMVQKSKPTDGPMRSDMLPVKK